MRLIYSLSQWSLLPLLAASLLLLSQWASAPVSVHALACGATASRSEVIQIAALFWGPVDVNETHGRTCWGNKTPLEQGLVPDGRTPYDGVVLAFDPAAILWYQTIILYQERLLDTAAGGLGGWTLRDGTIVPINITWFSVGTVASATASIAYQDERDPFWQTAYITTLSAQLANATGPQIPAETVSPDIPADIMVKEACETSGTCITVPPTVGAMAAAVCGGANSFVGAPFLPDDCIQRGRPVGSRRFLTSFCPLPDLAASDGILSVLASKGISKIFILAESWAQAIAASQATDAGSYRIQAVDTQIVLTGLPDWSSSGSSSRDVTERMIAKGAQAIIIIGSFNTPPLEQLLQYWQQINYQPQLIGWLKSGLPFIPISLQSYMLAEVSWVPTLSGSAGGWQASSRLGSWEPFPSNATHDMPAVFADAWLARWGSPDFTVFGTYTRWVNPLGLMMMPITMQKLFEAAQTDDTQSLMDAGAVLSVPSIFRTLQFNTFGMALPFDQYVVQIHPVNPAQAVSTLNKEVILTPLGLGEPAVFPAPSWSQRIYDPKPLSTPAEKAVLATNSISIALMVALAIVMIWKRSHLVIKAAAPVFCVLSLMGSVITLCSNYALSMEPSTSDCRANVWLLTFGFTLMMSSLLVKLGRLYFIFRGGKLQVVKITNAHLGVVLAFACLIDVILNATWSAVAPFEARTVITDVFRPYTNYEACHWTATATDLMYVHIAWKALIILVALVLTILTRTLPAAYNEATFLGASVYNVSVLLCFLLPVVSSGVGGRSGVYLLQAFGVQILVVSTQLVLFGPKLWMMARFKKDGARMASQGKGATYLTAAGKSVLSNSGDSSADITLPGHAGETAVSTGPLSNHKHARGASHPKTPVTLTLGSLAPASGAASPSGGSRIEMTRPNAWGAAAGASPKSLRVATLGLGNGEDKSPSSPNNQLVTENARLKQTIEQLRGEVFTLRQRHQVFSYASASAAGGAGATSPPLPGSATPVHKDEVEAAEEQLMPLQVAKQRTPDAEEAV